MNKISTHTRKKIIWNQLIISKYSMSLKCCCCCRCFCHVNELIIATVVQVRMERPFYMGVKDCCLCLWTVDKMVLFSNLYTILCLNSHIKFILWSENLCGFIVTTKCFIYGTPKVNFMQMHVIYFDNATFALNYYYIIFLDDKIWWDRFDNIVCFYSHQCWSILLDSIRGNLSHYYILFM